MEVIQTNFVLVTIIWHWFFYSLSVSQETYERNEAKRKSEVGLSETPDSTELTTKKAKVDEETPKVSETEEATPTNPVEASV